MQAIPCDRIRDLLDGVSPDRFADLFQDCLNAIREQGALAPFQSLGGRLLVAPDGIQIHCAQCSTRHVGAHKRKQCFRTMLSATVVADRHSLVLPLIPAFVQPQQGPAANPPEQTEKQRKQDCERNAAKRWLPAPVSAGLGPQGGFPVRLQAQLPQAHIRAAARRLHPFQRLD